MKSFNLQSLKSFDHVSNLAANALRSGETVEITLGHHGFEFRVNQFQALVAQRFVTDGHIRANLDGYDQLSSTFSHMVNFFRGFLGTK